MNAPNLGTENPMTDKEILVERVAKALWEHEFEGEGQWPNNVANIDEMRSLARAAIASMPHSEQVEAVAREVEIGRLVESMRHFRACHDGPGAHRVATPTMDRAIKVLEAVEGLTRNVSDKENGDADPSHD